MRLWHKDLIGVLPDKMLVAQWRELAAIVGSINKNGTPNHRLVNIVLDYDKSHFYTYTNLVHKEMIKRKMNPREVVYKKIKNYCQTTIVPYDALYEGWHNDRYYKQCYFNLEEKYDRGIISVDEWEKLKKLRCYND